MIIKHLQLETGKLIEQRKFYLQQLGFAPLEDHADGFTFKAGHSRLSFRASPGHACYHFAFNIPSDAEDAALDWLQKRVEVLSFRGKPAVDFPNWNAKAIYFRDPAGNVVEFIARRDLERKLEGDFSAGNILGISEVGLPVCGVHAHFHQLHTGLGIKKYWGEGEEFCAAGDEQGLFIIVDRSTKEWFPTDMPANPFPLEATVAVGEHTHLLQFDGECLDIAAN
ncbi:MAG: hypothetical protein R3350_00890 [Saprospiraceae bacterium]|nr:hypothetical protein [Saprospiraceae bacterium]